MPTERLTARKDIRISRGESLDRFYVSGSPEGEVFAPRGTMVIDETTGRPYFKTSDDDSNEGWEAVAFSSDGD